MNPIKKYRELRRELRRAKGQDIQKVKDSIAALEAGMTPKQLENIMQEYQKET